MDGRLYIDSAFILATCMVSGRMAPSASRAKCEKQQPGEVKLKHCGPTDIIEMPGQERGPTSNAGHGIDMEEAGCMILTGSQGECRRAGTMPHQLQGPR